MQTTLSISLTPEELRELLSETVAEQLATWQPPLPPVQDQAPDGYMGRKETAAFLHCSLSALQLWEKSGKLVPDRIGRKVLYRRSDVAQVLTGNQ